MNEEYRKYHSSPRMIKERDARNKARKEMVKKGRVKKGDGKEVDHKDGNPMHGGKNLQVLSRHANRVKQ